MLSRLLRYSNATRGVVFATAAINSNGTVANCFTCNRGNTVHLGTGLYQVGFNQTVTANGGWSRWLQVDTLTTGSISNVSCTTADRAVLPSGVFVECSDNATGNGHYLLLLVCCKMARKECRHKVAELAVFFIDYLGELDAAPRLKERGLRHGDCQGIRGATGVSL